jgi:tight adherence protein C
VTIVLFLGLVLLATGVTLLVRAVTLPSGRASETLQQITSYGFIGRTGEDREAAGSGRALDSLATSIGEYLGRRFSFFQEAELRRQLVNAGMYSTSPGKFIGYQALVAIGGGVLWLWLGGVTGKSSGTLVIGTIMTMMIGWLVPVFIVRLVTRQRRDEIDYEMPELIDLLVVSVEAGIGLNGAMRLAATRIRGPLGQELRLTLQEQNMGLSTTAALENLLGRVDTQSVRMFVRSIIQGETLGVSMGQIMRNLAGEMRKRRKAAAEERAQKAPVKMLFPLIFLIFPAMFVVLLLPALLTIVQPLTENV